MRCGRCDARVDVATVACEGQHGTVAVLLEGVPVPRCPVGHPQPAPAELAGTAILAILRERIPVARSRLLRADACSECGTALTLPGRRTRRSTTARLPHGLAPVTTTYDLPMVRCPDCATEQVPADAGPDLEAATRAALDGCAAA